MGLLVGFLDFFLAKLSPYFPPSQRWPVPHQHHEGEVKCLSSHGAEPAAMKNWEASFMTFQEFGGEQSGL